MITSSFHGRSPRLRPFRLHIKILNLPCGSPARPVCLASAGRSPHLPGELIPLQSILWLLSWRFSASRDGTSAPLCSCGRGEGDPPALHPIPTGPFRGRRRKEGPPVHSRYLEKNPLDSESEETCTGESGHPILFCCGALFCRWILERLTWRQAVKEPGGWVLGPGMLPRRNGAICFWTVPRG